MTHPKHTICPCCHRTVRFSRLKGKVVHHLGLRRKPCPASHLTPHQVEELRVTMRGLSESRFINSYPCLGCNAEWADEAQSPDDASICPHCKGLVFPGVEWTLLLDDPLKGL
jgi:hypothetical protein